METARDFGTEEQLPVVVDAAEGTESTSTTVEVAATEATGAEGVKPRRYPVVGDWTSNNWE